MSLFKPRYSGNEHPESGYNKAFISPTVQQNLQTSENDNSLVEEEVVQTKTNTTQEQFIKPQAILQRKPDPSGVQIGKQQEEVASEKEGDSKSEEGTSSSVYWTHDWHTDRYGREALFIWEVGGKRTYSNGDRGYAYIREMAALLPDDAKYDERFEKYKHRPQVGEGSNPKLNFWIKQTPGWDNPDHTDNGTADFNDLAEFKGTAENKKWTGFYYKVFVFDPQIYVKLAEEKRVKKNQEFIGNETNYRGYVSAENGILLHDTPTPFDAGVKSKRASENKSDFVIEFNQPLTVIAEANEQNEGWVMVRSSTGDEGWIQRSFVGKEPQAKTDNIFDTYTVKSGDKLENLIKSYYKTYPKSTGNDNRTIALAIYLYNKDKPGSGVYRNYDKYKEAGSWKDYADPWMQETRANYQSVELYAGGEVILPPPGYIWKMQQLGKVEKRPDFANIMIDSGRTLQGFIAGVGIGFWDALIGTGEDLYNMIADIFSGEIFNQIADMFKMFMEKGFSGIWEMIKDFASGTFEELEAAWNNPNPYQKGQYFGEIIGMILFEVVLALLTWGIGSIVKNSARAQKLLKLFPSLDKKKIVPNDVDNYADDINRMNRKKDADLDKDKKNSERDGNVSLVEKRELNKKAHERGFLNSSDELMGVEKASDELIGAISEKRRVVIAKEGSDELRMLEYFDAEASVGGEDMKSIILRENPSKAAILEEFLHGTQHKLGIIDDIGRMNAEAHVKDFMIRHRKILGLGDQDVQILKKLMELGL